MKSIEIFCDGSSLGNPGFGGYCAILRYDGKNGRIQKVLMGSQENATNNQMELLAVIQALKALKEPCQITLISDSKYVCDGISKWIFNWIKKDFKDVKNPLLWKEYLKLAKPHQITTQWVKGHDHHPENEECDKIARAQAQKLKDMNAKT